MRLRHARLTRALLLLPLLAAAACKDESPTLSGDENFPGGSRPVTLQVTVPAADFLTTLGVYTGFAGPADFAFEVVANQYGGALSARPLLQFGFPASVSYSQSGTSKVDTNYGVRGSRLVLVADTLASAATGPTTLRLNELAQAYDPATVSWEFAVDTAGGRQAWTTPGGTLGALLGQATYTRSTAGDSVVITLDSLTTARLRDTLNFKGAVLTAVEAGRRVQFRTTALIARVRPSNADRDTTIDVTVGTTTSLIFTPEPPQPAGTFQAGGIRAARTVFRLDLDRTVPGCPAGETCAPVALEDVQLNRVAILLRPVATPSGFNPLETVPLTLYAVPDPELGRRAPLGLSVLDAPEGVPVAAFAPGDTLVELPITGYTALAVRVDTLPTAFALLGEAPPSLVGVPRTFGVALFEASPRLRITYTLPTRPRLP